MYIIIPTGSRSLFSQTFQLFDIFCLSRAVLSLTSEISAEKSSAAHRRTVSNVPNVLAAILLQNIGTRLELQVRIGAWDTPHFIDHRKSVAHRTALTAPRHGPSRESQSAATHHTCTGQELRHFRAETFQDCFGG